MKESDAAPRRPTCEATSRWLEQLSQRVGHANELLRARIGVRHERQNQELLAAMNKRFNLLLRLQQAAELLSVAIFTYYSVNLIAYVTEEVEILLGIQHDPLLIKAILAPLVAGSVLIVMFRRRKGKPAA